MAAASASDRDSNSQIRILGLRLGIANRDDYYWLWMVTHGEDGLMAIIPKFVGIGILQNVRSRMVASYGVRYVIL
jgi:hypothetical protein